MPTTTGIATEFIQFSRTSNATLTDSDGKIKWAPANLLLNSESFDTASWTNDGKATVTANSVASPIGTTTADTLADTAVTDIHYAYQLTGTGVFSGTPYTFGVFVKPNTLDYVTVGLTNASSGTDYAVAVFRLSTSTVQTTGTSGTGYSIVGTPTISQVGGGWYYCSVTAIPGTTRPFLAAIVGLNKTGIISGAAGGLESYLGNGSSIYVWGAALYRSDLGGMQPNTSAYPLYNPTTPKNLLGFTESLTTGWTNTNTTDAIVGEVNPNGLTGAVDVAATAGNGTLLSSLSLLASPYTFSIWLKRKTGSGTVEITVDGTTYVAAAVTGTWTRFSTTLTPTAGTKTPGIRIVTSGDAVYVWGAQLSDSASLDTYSPVYGAAVTSAAYYGPRRDFNGSTLACNGLLVEEQRTNSRTYSSDFTQSSVWTLNSGTTVNSTTLLTAAPSGAVTAQAIVPVSNGSTNGVADETGLYLTGRVFSFYAKAGTGITIITGQDGAGNIFTINLSTGTGTFAAAYTYNSVVLVGNGWYRVAMNCSGTGTNFYVNSSTGANGTNHFFLWGVQLEPGSFSTSYIPTGAATATRNADVASVSTQAFPYSATEGTWVVSANSLAAQTASARYPIANATGNVYVLYSNNADTNIRSFDGTNVLAAAVSNFAAVNKFASAYGSGSKDLCVNGGAVATGTYNGGWASTDRLYIGSLDSGGNGSFFGHIRQITYIPRRLSNAELQTRTS